MRKLSLEEFIARANKVHNNLYCYSKAEYKGIDKKICIIDPEYGEFYQTGINHLKGHGNPIRGTKKQILARTLSKNEFIQRAQEIHGELYDYSQVVYINIDTKVCIIDPDYGPFWVIPYWHMKGGSHPRRHGRISRVGLSWLLSLENSQVFINPYQEKSIIINGKSRKVDGHNIDNNTIYEFHGSHWHGFDGNKITDTILYEKTLRKDQEIRDAGYNLVVMWEHDWKPTKEDWNKVPIPISLTQQFVEKAKIVHENTYDYSKVKFIKSSSKVCIIDPDYGEFWQTPNSHLNGSGSPYRVKKTAPYSTEVFIKLAQKTHGSKYDYSKTNYINSREKVCIIDVDYGEFWQIPSQHIAGYNHPKRSIYGYRPTQEEFIQKARAIHGNRFDYSLVEYQSCRKKVCIVNIQTGQKFYQTPEDHLKWSGKVIRKSALII